MQGKHLAYPTISWTSNSCLFYARKFGFPIRLSILYRWLESFENRFWVVLNKRVVLNISNWGMRVQENGKRKGNSIYCPCDNGNFSYFRESQELRTWSVELERPWERENKDWLLTHTKILSGCCWDSTGWSLLEARGQKLGIVHFGHFLGHWEFGEWLWRKRRKSFDIYISKGTDYNF